jgi:hypothetical protein
MSSGLICSRIASTIRSSGGCATAVKSAIRRA